MVVDLPVPAGNLLVLSLFFGRSRDTPRSARRIVAGQYLGFTVILAASLVGAAAAERLARHAVAYLGLIPIALGIVAGYRAWRDWGAPEPPVRTAQVVSALTMAGVTLANGGDNIGAVSISTPSTSRTAVVA
jgi:cadmium resistance protein CadD (predicted permease)